MLKHKYIGSVYFVHNKILDNTAGAINYVMAVIIEKATAYHNMKVKYAKAVAKSKYSKDLDQPLRYAGIKTKRQKL